MTKCQPDREISELFFPKKQLRIKVPELFRTGPLPKMTKEKVQVTQLLWWLISVIEISLTDWRKCSECGSRRLEINTVLSSVINIYWGLFCPMFRRIASCPQRYRRSRGHCWALTFMWSTALWMTPMWELFSSVKMLSAFCSRSWR